MSESNSLVKVELKDLEQILKDNSISKSLYLKETEKTQAITQRLYLKLKEHEKLLVKHHELKHRYKQSNELLQILFKDNGWISGKKLTGLIGDKFLGSNKFYCFLRYVKFFDRNNNPYSWVIKGEFCKLRSTIKNEMTFYFPIFSGKGQLYIANLYKKYMDDFKRDYKGLHATIARGDL